jgi:tRNA-2-methylthio-N6-dimethylallyladenosine synthase
MSDLIKDIDIIKPDEAQACETVLVSKDEDRGNTRRFYIESYGCQMNFSDSEIVTSILKKEGFDTTSDFNEADVVLLNTCSIREKAEQTIRTRLQAFNKVKKSKPDMTIAVLGCMAERLKEKLLEEEKIVDIVAGPDAYRDLPNLIAQTDDGLRAVNTLLSREETYADISPVRLNSNGINAYISIMRGCDNMCTFCVVPFTRGRERSRDPESIVAEAQDLFDKGYKEVMLLGQNVDSYLWSANGDLKGTAQIKKAEEKDTVNFAGLIEKVAAVSETLRVRFSTSHPKDITDEFLEVMAKHENVCNYIHLPAQSGNSRILEKMARTYTREWYLERVEAIHRIVGEDCGISSDFITGFCSETEEEHQDTVSLMEAVKFSFSYMFYYSERPGTLAEKKFEDDVLLEDKKRRLQEILDLQNKHSAEKAFNSIGKIQRVLIDGISKKNQEEFKGRNTGNSVVVFPRKDYQLGEYVDVQIVANKRGTLIGEIVD